MPGTSSGPAILAIDQGTSATKAIVWRGGIRSEVDVPVTGETRSGDAVEQDPEDVWASIVAAGRQALSAAGIGVDAVAVGNQGETVVAWRPASGEALGPALSWQDRRAVTVTDALAPATRDRLTAITGLPTDAYFAAPKMALLRRSVDLPDDATITTLDAFLTHRLCGAFVSDLATASRTQLLDPRALAWSAEALDAYGLHGLAMPDLVPCDASVGTTTAFGPALPVVGLTVDQQAALLAEGCLQRGDAKCTYGTGAFLLANVGADHRPSTSGLATSLAWVMSDGTRASCVDGQVMSAGSAVSWLQRMGIIDDPAEIDILAAEAADSGGVVFDVAFAGRGAPRWDATARASISGLSLGTERAQVIRAFVDGLAAAVAELARAAEADIGAPLRALRVDGGLTRSRILMQAQADSLGIPVEVYPHACATALGVAALGLRGVAGAGAESDVTSGWRPAAVHEPQT